MLRLPGLRIAAECLQHDRVVSDGHGKFRGWRRLGRVENFYLGAKETFGVGIAFFDVIEVRKFPSINGKVNVRLVALFVPANFER